jgi:flagellar motor protein MotB
MSAAEENLFSEEADHLFEEHVEHADERWLMSYADMMTLLFGLFVLLYSMFDQFEIIKESTEKKFGDEKQIAAPKLTEIVPPAESSELKAAQAEIDALKAKIIGLEVSLESANTKATRSEIIDQAITKAQTENNRIAELEEQIRALQAQAARGSSGSGASSDAPRASYSPSAAASASNPPAEIGAAGATGRPTDEGGGATPNPYQVTLTLPGGRKVDMKVRNLGVQSMQMPSIPDGLNGGEVFQAQISRNGVTLNVMVRSQTANGGGAANTLFFEFLTDRDIKILTQWENE